MLNNEKHTDISNKIQICTKETFTCRPNENRYHFLCSSLRNTNLSYLTSYPPNKISAKYFFEHVDKQKSRFDSNSFLKSQKQKFKTTIKYVSQHASFCTFGLIQTLLF